MTKYPRQSRYGRSAKGKATQAAYRRRKTYGLTREGFAWMLEQQGGACATCDRDAVCVDHDHGDGAVRALLCVPCNAAVGVLERERLTALRIHNYVEAHQ